jgi:hypothetical protein
MPGTGEWADRWQTPQNGESENHNRLLSWPPWRTPHDHKPPPHLSDRPLHLAHQLPRRHLQVLRGAAQAGYAERDIGIGGTGCSGLGLLAVGLQLPFVLLLILLRRRIRFLAIERLGSACAYAPSEFQPRILVLCIGWPFTAHGHVANVVLTSRVDVHVHAHVLLGIVGRARVHELGAEHDAVAGAERDLAGLATDLHEKHCVGLQRQEQAAAAVGVPILLGVLQPRLRPQKARLPWYVSFGAEMGPDQRVQPI